MSIEKEATGQAHEREHRPEVAHDQHEREHTRYETASEREHDRDEAAHEALKIATSTEEVKHPPRQEVAPAERRQGPITRKQLDHEFQATMKQVQEEMSPAQKAFSKVIHVPIVEKTSDFLGTTVARPNALLAGSVGAFLLTLTVYLFAKSVGYTLSGFEPIAAFIIGWIIGMLYDYFRIMLTGKK